MKKTRSKQNNWINKILSIKNIVSVIFLSLVFLLLNKRLGVVKTGIVVLVLAAIDYLVFYFKHGLVIHKIKKYIKKVGYLNATLIGGLIVGIIGIIGVGSFFAYIVLTAQDFDPDALYSKESSLVLDIDGNVIGKLGREKRERVNYSELPQVLIDAIIATEDSRYFQHNGLDLPRFAKATMGQIMGKAGAGGGSTISMQVIKNSQTSPDQTLTRKFTDIYLAVFELEKKYTKEQILEYYVNDPYMGTGGYGVEQASQAYFGKSVKDITLPEAALLAGLFQAPSAYDPFYYPENAYKRRNTVLNLMYAHGYITDEERKAADAVPITDLVAVKNTTSSSEYQGFIDMVVAEVERKEGVSPYNVPMIIQTTMEKGKQDALNKVYKTFTFKDDVVQAGTAVVDTKTGAIVAIGSGRDRKGERVFNFATQSNRQIGSTAKPLFDYAPGIEFLNWSTATPFVDEPHGYSNGGYIQNWDASYIGLTTLKEALGLSRNIPALKAYQQVGSKKSLEMISKLGLKPELENGYMTENHALGSYTGQSPLDVAAAYAAFGNKGYFNEPYSVTKITYRDTGKEQTYKSAPVKAMSQETASIITKGLVWGVDYGLAGSARVNGVKIAAKTGTTNFDESAFDQYKLPRTAVNDYWMAGYTSEYSVAIWFGYEYVNGKYYNTLGQNNHTKFYSQVFKGIFSGTKSNFTTPSSVIAVEIEKDTVPTMLPSEFTPKDMITTEYFKKGTEPTTVSPRFNRLNDVTNLTSTVEGTSIKLNWNYQKPDYMSDEYIKSQLDGVYKNVNNGLKARRNSDTKLLGDLIFNIYLKNNDGTLTKIGSTSENSFTYNAAPMSSYTIVVKTAYSKFASNEAKGAEVTNDITGGGTDIFSVLLTVTELVTIDTTKGETYIETTPIMVQDAFGTAINSSDYTVAVSYSKANVPITIDDLKTPGNYTITYKVTYRGKTEQILRYLTVL